jgi:hypothetical protein
MPKGLPGSGRWVKRAKRVRFPTPRGQTHILYQGTS